MTKITLQLNDEEIALLRGAVSKIGYDSVHNTSLQLKVANAILDAKVPNAPKQSYFNPKENNIGISRNNSGF